MMEANELESARAQIEDIDRQMAELFERRMRCSDAIASYKRRNGIPVSDPGREKLLEEKNVKYIENEAYRPYYVDFLRSVIGISRRYQIDISS